MAVQEPLIETPHYPAVAFLVRHGRLLAIVIGVVLALAGTVATLLGFGWAWAPVGFAAGILIWLLLQSYVEVLTIISETLLPQ
jgi:hypothetical protein